ncbi:hypothetical protein F5B18DRAFT_652701 [Nemania serpens]|nr:hypothetical protein F5B18DRAFT_652701 [Nemania serpens]
MAQAKLRLLPRELRDQIYHLVFAGSRLSVHDEVLVYAGDTWARITVPQLGECLGDLEKSRIRHIRAVHGDFESRISIAQFPRLETCEFFGLPLMASGFWKNSTFDDADDEAWIDFAAWGQFLWSDPQEILKLWCETDAQASTVQFLMTFPIYSINARKSSRWFPRRVYVNMRTKKYSIRDSTNYDETVTEREEGLRRVMS